LPFVSLIFITYNIDRGVLRQDAICGDGVALVGLGEFSARLNLAELVLKVTLPIAADGLLSSHRPEQS